MNKSVIPLIFLVLCGLLSCSQSFALDVDVSTHLKKQLGKLDSFTATFNQRLIDLDQTNVDPSSGKIIFKRPGRFVWSYAEPYEQEIISDGQNLWVYDKDLEQVTVRPARGQATQTPLQILDEPETVDQHYTIELLTEREDVVEIQLTPLAKDTGFKYVILIFEGDELSGMEIYDSFDHYNSLTFSNIKLGVDLDNERFSFVPPEGIDIIDATE